MTPSLNAMTTTSHDARKIETAFLTAMGGRLDAATGWLPGSSFRRSQDDERQRLRDI